MGGTKHHAEPLSIVAKNVTVGVCGSRISKTRATKTLLHNIDLCCRPGELVAIMGPSGAGKSTLLNALAARITPKTSGYQFCGDIFVNGEVNYRRLRRSTNVVPQHPKMKTNLTTEEIITMACRLRTTRCQISAADQAARVDRVLTELGLLSKRHLLPGNDTKKSMSGGEQRLVAIAHELVDNPSILLLDEPTTGLDSARAYDVIEMLSSLAKSEHIVVVCTVHQPRSQAFLLFDKIILLSGGRIVFHGAPLESIDFFDGIGCSCPNNFNPADFMLDLITPVPATELKSQPPMAYDKIGDISAEMVTDQSTVHEVITAEDDDQHLESIKIANQSLEPGLFGTVTFTSEGRGISLAARALALLPTLFQRSHYGKRLSCEIRSLLKESPDMPGSPTSRATSLMHAESDSTEPPRLQLPPSLKALAVLVQRDFQNDIRDPARTSWQVLMNLGLGLILGGIFLSRPKGGTTQEQTVADARNIAGAIFALTMQLSVSSFDIIYSFEEERVVMNREAWRGYYSTLVYFVSRTITDLPFNIIPSLLRVVLFYYLTQIGSSPSQLFHCLLICSISIWTSCSLSFLVSAIVHRADIGMYVGPLATLFLMLSSGYFISDNALPSFIGWVKYVSVLRYTFFGVIHVIFDDGRSWGEGDGQLYSEELRALISFDLLSYPLCVFMLLCLAVILRALTFVFLRFTHRRVGLNI